MKKFLAIILLLLSLTGISYAAETEVIGLNVTEYGGKTIYGGLTVPSGGASITGGLTINPTLGAEKAIDGTFTVGTCVAWTFNVADWTCGATNIAKDQDGTNTLSQDMTEAAGEVYYVTIDVTGFSAGTFTVSVGASATQTVDSANGATQSITQYHTAYDGTNFTITPSNASRFVLDNISVKKVTNVGLSLYNSVYIYGGQLLFNRSFWRIPVISVIGSITTGFGFGETGMYPIILHAGIVAAAFQYDLTDLASIVRMQDVSLARLAAGSIAIGGIGNAQTLNIRTLTEETTILAAATTDTAIQIPANAVVFGVSVRVTTVIPTAATFTVIGTTTSTAFNTAAVGVAAGSTDTGTKTCPYNNATAQTIRITPNAQPAAATGKVRITIHYYDITPPTS